MTVQTTINECVEILEENFDSEIKFPDPIKIKTSPHMELFTCYGAATSYKRLTVMDGAGQWHEVSADQANVKYIVNSLFQRLKILEHERV